MWWLRRKTAAESFRHGETNIRVDIDRAVDAARVVVSDEPVARTMRIEGMGLADFDEHGNLVALELFRISQQIEEWRRRQETPTGRDLAEDLQAFAARSVERAREHAKTM
jgi:hypothetical protein